MTLSAAATAARRPSRAACLLVLAVLVCVAVPRLAAAEEGWSNRDYEFASRQLNDFTDRFRNSLVDPLVRGVRDKRPAAKSAQGARAPKPDDTSAPFAQPKVPAELAAYYPPAARARVEQYFARLLDGYVKVESDLRLPRNDIPGALASFIAGSYMAYTNIPFPDAHFRPLLGQMRGILADDPQFLRASKADKQAMFEHLAILGMLMATSQLALQKQPDAERLARLREAAKGYLEQILRTDAERVRIDEQGLTIEPHLP